MLAALRENGRTEKQGACWDPFKTGRREREEPSRYDAHNPLIRGGADEDGRCDSG